MNEMKLAYAKVSWSNSVFSLVYIWSPIKRNQQPTHYLYSFYSSFFIREICVHVSWCRYTTKHIHCGPFGYPNVIPQNHMEHFIELMATVQAPERERIIESKRVVSERERERERERDSKWERASEREQVREREVIESKLESKKEIESERD